MNRARHNCKKENTSYQARDPFKELLSLAGIDPSAEIMQEFLAVTGRRLWEEYSVFCQTQLNKSISDMSSLKINIPNGEKGISFSCDISYPIPEGIESIEFEITVPGLTAHYDEQTLHIDGIPTESGDFSLKAKIKHRNDMMDKHLEEVELPITIRKNRQEMWKNIPTKDNIPYFKPDSASSIKQTNVKTIIAASQRGRSHANEGKPRDDHFAISYDERSGWYILAVADGAGSAEFSRKGSSIACEETMRICNEKLADPTNALEQAMTKWANKDEQALKNDAHKEAYNLLAKAALQARNKIIEEARTNNNSTPEKYATTLLLTVCKQVKDHWLVASFWIGDGAIGLYSKEGNSIKLMGNPDSGAHAGETLFLTSNDVFKNAYDRIRVAVVNDFTAIFLMTDGITDPKFETEANLENVELWNKLWNELPKDRTDGTERKLLEWTGFYSEGNHDDRTIVILF